MQEEATEHLPSTTRISSWQMWLAQVGANSMGDGGAGMQLASVRGIAQVLTRSALLRHQTPLKA